MASKIGIIGRGNVGSALAKGLDGKYEVKTVGKEPDEVKKTAQWAEVIILAVPFSERQNALKAMGDIKDKVLVDVSNALTVNMEFALDLKKSGAEQVQEWTTARVVKAFNTVFAQHMSTGEVLGEKLTLLIASDDASAKKTVADLGKAIGFDVVDAGPLKNARYLETLGYLNIQLGYVVGMGPDMGFRLVHK